MFRTKKHTVNSLLCVLWLMLSSAAHALDIIKITKSKTKYDVRSLYKITVLKKALDASSAKYGAYEIQVVGNASPVKRAVQEVHAGIKYNLTMASTTEEWERETIPIRIPIRRGISNYRLLTVRTDSVEDLRNMGSIEELSQYRVALRIGWALTDIFQYLDFNVIQAHSYDGIFNMLSMGRADYIPRGIHEIYDEIEARKPAVNNLTVLPDIALFIPSPYYIFVSPSEPRIAERIRDGLELLIENGELQRTFEQFYGEYLRKAELDKRRIIYVGNPLLPNTIPLEDSRLWFTPPNKITSPHTAGEH